MSFSAQPIQNLSARARRGGQNNHRKTKARRDFRRVFLEQLEGRQLMASLPIGLDDTVKPPVVIPGDTGDAIDEAMLVWDGSKVSPTDPRVQAWPNYEFVTDSFLVRFQDSVTRAEAEATLAAEAPGSSIKTWDDNSHYAWVNLPVGTTRDDVLAVSHHFLGLDNTLVAEPNFLKTLMRRPNDPAFDVQWSLDNTGQPYWDSQFPLPYDFMTTFPLVGLPDADIDAPEAWDLTVGSPDVIVAVLDTGMNLFEPYMDPNFWKNPNEIFNGIDDDGNGVIDDYYGYDAAEDDGDPQDAAADEHGINVSSVIAAPGDDGQGVAGVSWHSKIMTVKVADDIGSITTGGVIGAYRYVTKMKSVLHHNIVAANMSYGGYAFSFSEFEALSQLNNTDTLLAIANDNTGTNHDLVPVYPAGYELNNIITVTASDGFDEIGNTLLIPDFGYGRRSVDLAAPGIEIMMHTFRYPFVIPPNTFPFIFNLEVATGTSFATPHVAGVAALAKSLAPYLSAQEVKQLIMSTVDPMPQMFNLTATGGRLNAFNTLSAIPKTTISGTVFQDANNDKAQNPGETGLGGWTVYLDLDNDGVFDPNEPNTVTVTNTGTTGPLTGTYSFDAWVDTGTYRVRQVVMPDFVQTTPTANGGAFVINVGTRGQDFANLNFGARMTPGSISGFKFLDLDGDGTFDANESGQAGILFYVDLNNNGRINAGEPGSYTDASGNFIIPNVQPGTYNVREVLKPGYLPTLPNTVGANGLPDPVLSVIVVSNQTTTPALLFGNRVARDWGDLPEFVGGTDAYNTRSINGGPSHGVLPGFMLGQRVDFEVDGQPSVTALGDDGNPTGALTDEDGLVNINLVQGSQGEVSFRVTNIGRSAGLVQAWIDFNGDGDFADTGEQILRNFTPANGLNTNVPFSIPAGVIPGVTYARFRYAYERNLGPDGAAQAGEVEDYQITIFSALPTARDDRFPEQLFPPPNDPAFPNDPLIKQESANNVLDVLRNDPLPAMGTLTIVPGSFPTTTQNGGTLTLATVSGMQVLLYTPRAGVNPFTGVDTFTYRVTNGTDTSLPATVLVRVTASDPRAVDNTFTVAGNVPSNPNPQPASYTFDVLANDVNTPSAPIQLVNFTQPTYPAGVVLSGPTLARDTANPNLLVFTPPTGFVGTVQFTYVIDDNDPTTVPSTGTVTLQVTNVPTLPPATSYLAMLSVEVRDARGNLLGTDPAFRVDIGETFYVHVFSEDLRPGGDGTNRGVEAAYLDLLYDRNLAAVNFVETVPGSGTFIPDVTFDPGYDFDRNRAGFNSPEGVYQELGAAHNSLDDVPPGLPLGKGRKPVLIVGFDATAAGSLKIIPDPAEDSMNRSQIGLAPEPTDPNFPSPIPAPDTQVFLLESPSFQIKVPGAPEFINSRDALDVNADSKITAFDALAVVNELNKYGSRRLADYDMAIGGGLPPSGYVDTNGDGQVTAFDALGIINWLNVNPNGVSGSAGEGGGGGGEYIPPGSGGESTAGEPAEGGSSSGLSTFSSNTSTSTRRTATPLVSSLAPSSTLAINNGAAAETDGAGEAASSDPQENSELLYLTAIDELMSQDDDDREIVAPSGTNEAPTDWLVAGSRRSAVIQRLSRRR